MASLEMIRLAKEAGGKDPVLRSAPTGVAAHLFLGHTLHSLLMHMLPIKGRNEDDVSSGGLQILQVFDYRREIDGLTETDGLD